MPTRTPHATLAALPTPFTPAGDLDLDAAARLVERIAASDAEGVFLAGTTGEFPALEPDERIRLLEIARRGLGDKRLVAHVGAASARQTIGLLTAAQELGVTEFAAITPYFLPVEESAILDYYAALGSHAAGGALYVYHFPDRTGAVVPPRLMAELARIPGIAGAKLSGLSWEEVAQYAAAVPAGFDVYTGNDADFPKAAGGAIRGVVSGVYAAFPETFDRLADDGASADRDRLLADLDHVVTALAGDIGRIKTVLEARAVCGPTTRMALPRPDAAALSALATDYR